MIDVSFQNATLTLKGAGLGKNIGKVDLKDVADTGNPIEFGEATPIGYARTLGGNLVGWVTSQPITFNMSLIPGSKSDLVLRKIVAETNRPPDGSLGTKVFADVSAPYLLSAELDVGQIKYTFENGWVYAGSTGPVVSQEGKRLNGNYRFVFSSYSVEDSDSGEQTSGNGDFHSRWDFPFIKIPALQSSGAVDLPAIEISVGHSATTISHPIETGSRIFDHRYLNPKTITVKLKVSKGFEKIVEQWMSDRSTAFGTVGTTVSVYRNITPVKVSHTELADHIGLYDYSLELQQVLMTKVRGVRSPSDESDRDTMNELSKQGTTEKPQEGDL